MRRINFTKSAITVLAFFICTCSICSQIHEADSLEKVLLHIDSRKRPDIFLKIAQIQLSNNLEKALDFGQRVLASVNAYDDSSLYTRDGLYVIAKAYLAKGELDSSLSFTNRLKAWASINKDKKGFGQYALLKGKFLMSNGDMDKAEDFIKDALANFEIINDKVELSKAYFALGQLYQNKSNYPEALRFFDESMALLPNPEDALVANSISNKGYILEKQGQREQAKILYDSAIHLLNVIGDKSGLASIYNNLGIYYTKKNKLDQGLKYFQLAGDLHEKVGNRPLLARSIMNIGIVKRNMGQLDDALKYYDDALKKFQSMNDQKGMALVLGNIGVVYQDWGDFEASIESLIKSLKIYEELKNPEGVARTSHNIANNYYKIKQYSKSLQYFEKSLAIKEKIGKKSTIARTLGNMSDVHAKLGDFQMAKGLLNKALQIRGELNDQKGVAHSLIGLCILAKKQGLLNESLEMGDSSLFIAKSIGNISLMSEIQKVRSEIFSELGMYKEAYETHLDYKLLYDSLFRSESNVLVKELQEKYKTKEQRQQIAIMERDQLINKIWMRALIGGIFFIVVVALMIGLVLYFRLKLSRQLLVKEKQLDKLKTDFFANISHEQRTPLTLISGAINQLLKSDHIHTEDWNKLNRVMDQTNNLIQMTDQIMDLSKLEDKRIELLPAPVNLHRLLKFLFAAFESTAAAKQINYIFNFLLDTEMWINIDAKRFGTIINNLIQNAIKYTQEGGEVCLIVDETISSEQLKIIVKDNGRGIIEKDQEQVFDRYFQATTVESVPEGGVGIGLAMVRELVILFGGEIILRSKLGEGSTFVIVLPIEKVQSGTEGEGFTDKSEEMEFSELLASLTIEPTEKRKKKASLLIAEDHPDMRDYLKDILASDYELSFAVDGKEALDMLNKQKEKIDLLITDVMMPNLDGFSLLERLRFDEQFYGLPVIMLTARTEDKDKIRALRLGVDDYMTKPFSDIELMVRVKNLLQRRQSRIDFANYEDLDDAEIESFSPDINIMKQVEEIYREQLANAQFSVQDLADKLTLSRRTVLRKVKRTTGLSPNEYFREIRLMEAREMLISGNHRSVSEVCYAVGFDSPGYFTKMYIKRFGKKPSAYIYQKMD